MGKKLVIAEKPSVAADIARALGGMSRKPDYFENDEYIVSSAVGHLLELAVPEAFEVKKGKWTFKHLPVIPPHFELAPIERSARRLELLLRVPRGRATGTGKATRVVALVLSQALRPRLRLRLRQRLRQRLGQRLGQRGRPQARGRCTA